MYITYTNVRYRTFTNQTQVCHSWRLAREVIGGMETSFDPVSASTEGQFFRSLGGPYHGLNQRYPQFAFF
jgi:hypothetical protein